MVVCGKVSFEWSLNAGFASSWFGFPQAFIGWEEGCIRHCVRVLENMAAEFTSSVQQKGGKDIWQRVRAERQKQAMEGHI